MIKAGMEIKGVSTSLGTTEIARSLDIDLYPFNEINKIDITIDGIDEVDNSFNAIKGGGGAMLYEKIVASASEKVVWIGDSSKLVGGIGRFPLPVEVNQFSYAYIFNMFKNRGMNPVIRKSNGELFITDSGNYIIDLHLGRIDNPEKIASWLDSVPGIIEHGLFINMADIVIIGCDNSTQTIANNRIHLK
jgi:ribose 5-phosphate isomerase A